LAASAGVLFFAAACSNIFGDGNEGPYISCNDETDDVNYILRPVIRLVVDGQAGSMSGTLSGAAEGSNYVVFAYESGEYDDS